MATPNGRLVKAELIPWDYTSAAHADRMYQQRVTCGWASSFVDKWKAVCATDAKTFYWVVLKDDFPGKDELLAQHFAKFPEELSPLHDTATTHWGAPREPTGRAFTPVGHIALELLRPDDERAGPQPTTATATTTTAAVAWIGPFYISWALQRGGLGTFAMAEAERLAAAPPLGAGAVCLDAIPPEQALEPKMIKAFHHDRGFPPPAIANHIWYERQGYRPFLRKDDMYPWTDPETKEPRKMSTVYLKKSLQRGST